MFSKSIKFGQNVSLGENNNNHVSNKHPYISKDQSLETKNCILATIPSK